MDWSRLTGARRSHMNGQQQYDALIETVAALNERGLRIIEEAKRAGAAPVDPSDNAVAGSTLERPKPV